MNKKNILIASLLVSNCAFGFYILAKDDKPEAPKARKPAANVVVTEPEAAAQAKVYAPGINGADDVKICYQTFLARRPLIDHGKVVVHWKINREGRIDFLELAKTEIPDRTFMECILDKIRTTRFPAPPDRVGVLIAHTFKFRK